MADEDAARVLAFRVNWPGGVTAGQRLDLTTSASLNPHRHYVLAFRDMNAVKVGWVPVERYVSDAVRALSRNEPADGHALAGVTEAGTYALFEFEAVQGVIRGTAEAASGALLADVEITTPHTPWRDVTRANGQFETLGFLGSVDVFGERARTGQSGDRDGQTPTSETGRQACLSIPPNASGRSPRRRLLGGGGLGSRA